MNPPLSRVLIVDDGQDDAFVLSHLLEKAGLPVTPQIFSSGETILNHLVEACGRDDPLALPTAVFLDVWLPGVSGFDVLKWVRAHEALQSVVIILLSGSDEPRNLGKGAQLGADGYVVKFPSPLAMRELLTQIHKAATSPWPRPVLQVSSNLLMVRTAV